MPFIPALFPAPAAKRAVPYTYFTDLISNDNWHDTLKPWVLYTPTLTNLTLGNGTLVGKWFQVGKKIDFHIALIWGSTTSASGTASFSLPVAPAGVTGNPCLGVGAVTDVSTGNDWSLRARFTGGVTIQPITGDGASASGLTATAPFIFTTSDQVHVHGRYEGP